MSTIYRTLNFVLWVRVSCIKLSFVWFLPKTIVTEFGTSSVNMFNFKNNTNISLFGILGKFSFC